MTEHLLVIDTPGIKKNISESSSLKGIRGASATLDGLNRGWLWFSEPVEFYRQIVESCDICLSQFIYANGGSGMMVVDAPGEKNLQRLERNLQQRYREQTDGAVVPLVAWETYDAQNFQRCVQQAHWQLRRKRSCRNAEFRASSPWACYDKELRNYRAERLYKGAGDTEEEIYTWISSVSYLRKRSSENRQVWKELEEYSGRTWKPPQSLDEIAGEDKVIAVVYADGNGMGKTLKELTNPKEYAAFSEEVDRGVRRATFEALQQIFSQARFDIILLGGDDIVIVLPPQYVGEFVLKTHEQFVAETSGKSLSFGISVAYSHYPFYQLVEQAEACLRNAKAEKNGVAAVDFHINRSGLSLDVMEYRNREFLDDRICLIRRPFAMAEFEEYLEAARRLVHCGVPSSRLHYIGRELQKKRKNVGHIGWITGVGRARRCEHRDALRDLLKLWHRQHGSDDFAIEHRIAPWKQEGERYICGFHDVLELCELVEGGGS